MMLLIIQLSLPSCNFFQLSSEFYRQRLFPDNLILYSSLKVQDEVSHPYK